MANGNGVFEIVLGKNVRGEHIFSVIVKRTFRIRNAGVAERAEVDHALRKTDSYYEDGDPEFSTVEYEYELAPYKPMVDIVVLGKAYAPGGVPTQEMIASVQVSTHQKSITVVGDRECHYRKDESPVISDPKPFTEMEIRYERAYGGRDEKSDPNIPFFYPRNHMGTGVVVRNVKDSIEGLPLPNLEDPDNLLTPDRIVVGGPGSWPNQPLPQGFGWFQRTWYPRSLFAGSFPPYVDVDTVTQEERLGLVPPNHIVLAKQFKLPSYQPRFNNGASCGMLLPEIKGDESVTLQGLSPKGLLKFDLPGETPLIVLDIGQGERQLQARLDTVSIRPDDLELDLIWRSSHIYEGYSWLPQMKRLHAEVQ